MTTNNLTWNLLLSATCCLALSLGELRKVHAADARTIRIHVAEDTEPSTVGILVDAPLKSCVALEEGPLTIDCQTGAIQLRPDVKLDHEFQPRHVQRFRLMELPQTDVAGAAFLKYLDDSGVSPDAIVAESHELIVQLYVTNCNETPQFTSHLSSLRIMRGARRAETSINWFCFDSDQDDSIHFELLRGHANWALDAMTGRILCQNCFALESVAETVVIRATDAQGEAVVVTQPMLYLAPPLPPLPTPPVAVESVAVTVQHKEADPTPPPAAFTEVIAPPAIDIVAVATTEESPMSTTDIAPPATENIQAATPTVVVATNPVSTAPMRNSVRNLPSLQVSAFTIIAAIACCLLLTGGAAGRAWYLYRVVQIRSSSSDTDDVLQKIESSKNFTLSDADMKLLLWGALALDPEDREATSELTEEDQDWSANTDFAGIEDYGLQSLPMDVLEATSRGFRLPASDRGTAHCILPDVADVHVDMNAEEHADTDEISQALAALAIDESVTESVNDSLFANAEFELPREAPRAESIINSSNSNEESTIEEWLRRVAPGYQALGRSPFTISNDFQLLDQVEELQSVTEEYRQRRVPDGYREQQRSELESFRQVAISATQFRLLEEEHAEQMKSWTSVAIAVLACMMVGAVCIERNWLGYSGALLGWPLIGVGSIILVRHLAGWIPVWRRLTELTTSLKGETTPAQNTVR